MNRYICKIQRNYIDHGLLITLKKILKQLLSPIFLRRVYRIYSIEFNNFDRPSKGIKCIEIIRLEPNNFKIINEIEMAEEWLSGKVSDKLKNGGVCIVALDGDKLAGFNMIGFGDVYVPLIDTFRHIEKDAAWSEQITVKKDYRGAGLGKVIRYAAFHELKKMGIKRLYGGTLLDNEPSLRLSRSTGFKELFDIHYYKIFGFRTWRNVEVTNGIR